VFVSVPHPRHGAGRCTGRACPPASLVSSWHHFSMSTEKRISLRLPTELHARLVARATADRRSLNSEIVYLLETALGTATGDAGSSGGESAFPAPLRGKPDSSPAFRSGHPLEILVSRAIQSTLVRRRGDR